MHDKSISYTNTAYHLLKIGGIFLISISYAFTITYTSKPIFTTVLLIGIIFLLYYVKKVIEDVEYAFPPIICLFWLVYFEPAPCDILAGVAILIFFINICIGRADIGKLSFPDVALFIFFAFSATSVLKSENLSQSIFHLIISFYLILFHFFISRIVKSYEQIEKLMKFYIVPSLITALVMICAWFEIGQSFFIRLRGIFEQGYPIVSSFIPFYSGREYLMAGFRVNAFFKDPNVAGPFLIPLALFSLATIIRKGERRRRFILFLMLCMVGVFFSLSRAAIVSLLVGVILLSLLSFNLRNIAKIAITIMLLAVSIVTLHLSAPEKFTRIGDTRFGVESRIIRFEKGLHKIKESPLVGIGLGEESPHDTYLLRFTQSGIIGGTAFLSFLIYLIIKLFSLYRQTKNINDKIIVLTLLIVLFSFIPLGFVVSMAHWRHFWFFTGLSLALIRMAEKNEEISVRQNGLLS